MSEEESLTLSLHPGDSASCFSSPFDLNKLPYPTLVAQEQSLGTILNFCFSHQKVLWTQPPKQFLNSAHFSPSPYYHFGQSRHHFPWHLFELECCFQG